MSLTWSEIERVLVEFFEEDDDYITWTNEAGEWEMRHVETGDRTNLTTFAKELAEWQP